MLVLVAYDLSIEAERAADLISRTPWPPGTSVRIVTSPSGLGTPLSSFTGPVAAGAHARRTRAAIEMEQARIADVLRRGGLRVETAIVPGTPAEAVVGDAAQVGADLVVAGAGKQGPLSAAVLGSVSSEIAERSPCSVLIARTAELERVVLAIDESVAAMEAAAVVAAWPLFAAAEIQVVGVADPAASGLDTESVVARTVAMLAGHDRAATAEIRNGDPRAQIVAAAQDWPADLVVLGVNGEPLIRRLLLGTVARGILHAVSSSVLVVRRTPSRRGQPSLVSGS